MFLVKACLRDVVRAVQGCSNISDISARISVHKSPIDKTLRAKWKAFVDTHTVVHISNQMVTSLFDLTILRQIPLKDQSMWMALLEG